jgi:methionyl aminopeptidase
MTVPVGKISKADQDLLAITNEALLAGINTIGIGTKVGDVGATIASYAKKAKYGIIRELAGHGVGKYIHEDPFIPNYGVRGKGVTFVPGMVVAIEPMFTRGGEGIMVLNDGYTVKTTDNSKSAHFEHTVLITETGAEILTLPRD